jgi:glycosyltransferase involved in cell wall biosynthesis
MHIGFVSDQYPPYPLGGIGARVTDLARGLVANGHKVTVAGVYPRNRGILRMVDETLEGVRVVRLPAAPQWMRWRPGLLWERYALSAALRRFHREAPFDLVEYTDGFGWALFGTPPGVPSAIRIEGSARLFDDAMGVDGDRFTYWMEGQALKRAHSLSALSHYAKRETLRLFGLERRECAVIHNAVDVKLFSPGSDCAEPGLIVFANSIEERKGVQEIVAAMNDICDSHPEAHLVLIGSDSQPLAGGRSYSGRVMDAVRPEFRARIRFTGRLDRYTGVLEYLRKASVCCYPSRIETFGVAPLEAMAVGKPVVYYNKGPGPELIEDGVSGLLCDATSPQAIAACIKRVLADPSLAQALGDAARARAVAMFNKDAWVGRNIEYYRECIASYRAET